MPVKYGMVIDLHQCVGCGACALACKNENNTRGSGNGQTHNWADFVMKTEGTFPNVKYRQMPVLCNHCSNAPCVEACPEEPKAMFKADDNTTLHNQERCIGCQECQIACPYSSEEVDSTSSRNGTVYSVISYNDANEPTYPEWKDNTSLIPGGTSSPREVVKKVGATPPDHNKFKSGDYKSVRRDDVVEKCIFCHHRITNGLLPACVDACPADARIFGDLNDSSSEIARTLKKHKSLRLKEEEGTEPNVYYVRSYENPEV